MCILRTSRGPHPLSIEHYSHHFLLAQYKITVHTHTQHKVLPHSLWFLSLVHVFNLNISVLSTWVYILRYKLYILNVALHCPFASFYLLFFKISFLFLRLAFWIVFLDLWTCLNNLTAIQGASNFSILNVTMYNNREVIACTTNTFPTFEHYRTVSRCHRIFQIRARKS